MIPSLSFISSSVTKVCGASRLTTLKPILPVPSPSFSACFLSLDTANKKGECLTATAHHFTSLLFSCRPSHCVKQAVDVDSPCFLTVMMCSDTCSLFLLHFQNHTTMSASQSSLQAFSTAISASTDSSCEHVCQAMWGYLSMLVSLHEVRCAVKHLVVSLQIPLISPRRIILPRCFLHFQLLISPAFPAKKKKSHPVPSVTLKNHDCIQKTL